MEFGLSEEQRMLAESVRRWADSQVDPERLKALVDAGETADSGLLAGLAELGAFGIMAPEGAGGSDMTLLDACVVQQALGRNAVPLPFTASGILAPIALQGTAAADDWLPRLVAGEAWLGVGIAEVTGVRPETGLQLADGSVSGCASFVLDGAGADGWLLAVGQDTLVLVAADSPGLKAIDLTSIDHGRSLIELQLDKTPAQVIGEAGGEADRIARLLAAGRVALAFDTLGAAERMLERAVGYSLERKQFNRVIGSFQAVKHLCAEMAAEIEPCHSLLWYAAYAHDAYPEEFQLMACHAKAHMGEVGTMVARTSTEVHGGMGFTHEMGLHYFFKRIGLNRQLFGNPDSVRQHAARLQGWTRAAG